MALLFGVLRPLQRLNDLLLWLGKWLAVSALALMVLFILGQVFFRYVMNDAPNWTEEGARFLMLWMTALMAPTAYRMGGFVAIDMLERALPARAAHLLQLFLLAISMAVLLVMLDRAWNNHIWSLTGRGMSASLRLPLDLVGGESVRFRNNWAFASLGVGLILMILVGVELILRQLIALFGGADRLKPLGDPAMARAD